MNGPRAGAIALDDCPTCRNGGDRACPRFWEHVACSQAKDLNRRAERIRELIRERDHEKSRAEAAYDLAEQYARKTGADINRDQVLRYVTAYWEQRGQFERAWTDLETFRWDIVQLVYVKLENGLRKGRNGEGAPIDHMSGREVAERIRDWVKSHPNFGGSAKRRPDELFGRPKAPETTVELDLFGGRA